MSQAIATTNFPFLGKKTTGKVRDLYEYNDTFVMVITDRYSAFDRNLANVPSKGQALAAITTFWFDATSDIIPNQMIAHPDPNVLIAKKCTVLPLEVIVRGFITGVTNTSLWTHYADGKRDFGDFVLPDGMTKNQKLEKPVITPTTKDVEHDVPTTSAEIIENGAVSEKIWREIQEKAIALFKRGQNIAHEKGLILVDTKYEFGIDVDGNLTLIDEIHTPDSSRYWIAESYQARLDAGEEPEYFDKEFLRLWFKDQVDPYSDASMPDAPPEMIAELGHRYRTIAQMITGNEIIIPEESIHDRIEQNLKDYFTI